MKYKLSNYTNYKDTLCWRCANAHPNLEKTRGCSWSRKLIPVEGWKAEKTTVYCQRREGRKLDESYIVRSCPEFISDGRENE